MGSYSRKKMDAKSIMREAGLIENEVNLYINLLDLGESSASNLAIKCGLHRTHVYDVIENLIKKGFVSYVIRDGAKYYRASPPERVLEFIKEKREHFEELESEMKHVLHTLLEKGNSPRSKESVEVYSGKEGIKTIYNEILRTVKEYYVLGATGKIAEELEFYFPHHEKERIKRKIKVKLLFNSELKGKSITRRDFAEIRYLPPEHKAPVPITMYEDKVAILVWRTPSAILIKERDIAKTYKDYFNFLWQISKD